MTMHNDAAERSKQRTKSLVTFLDTVVAIGPVGNAQASVHTQEFSDDTEDFHDTQDSAQKAQRARILSHLLATRIDPFAPIWSERRYPAWSGCYSTTEAAKKLGVSTQTVRRMIDAGEFPRAFVTPGGHWRIPKDYFIADADKVRMADALRQRIGSDFDPYRSDPYRDGLYHPDTYHREPNDADPDYSDPDYSDSDYSDPYDFELDDFESPDPHHPADT
ncbi:MAG: helix-turn-helix domain-containing protein [Alicyclobacillus sp.]|nr:helix-turn-helix domain-containing protein [Alicyclobacillus sp.]